MSFQFINKNVRLNNLKTTTAMNAKMLVFAICVEEILCLLLSNLHDCTFNLNHVNRNTDIKLQKNYSAQNSVSKLCLSFRRNPNAPPSSVVL